MKYYFFTYYFYLISWSFWLVIFTWFLYDLTEWVSNNVLTWSDQLIFWSADQLILLISCCLFFCIAENLWFFDFFDFLNLFFLTIQLTFLLLFFVILKKNIFIFKWEFCNFYKLRFFKFFIFLNPYWPILSNLRSEPKYFLGSKKGLLAKPK